MSLPLTYLHYQNGMSRMMLEQQEGDVLSFNENMSAWSLVPRANKRKLTAS